MEAVKSITVFIGNTVFHSIHAQSTSLYSLDQYTSVVLNLRSLDVLGSKHPEAFITSSAGQDF